MPRKCPMCDSTGHDPEYPDHRCPCCGASFAAFNDVHFKELREEFTEGRPYIQQEEEIIVAAEADPALRHDVDDLRHIFEEARNERLIPKLPEPSTYCYDPQHPELGWQHAEQVVFFPGPVQRFKDMVRGLFGGSK